MAWFKSEYAQERRSDGNLKGNGMKLLSSAYKAQLGNLVTEELREQYKLPMGATWADFIALHTVKRAVGIVTKEQICFTAIQELRESTEGKTPERSQVEVNSELAALSRAINGTPAEAPSGPATSED